MQYPYNQSVNTTPLSIRTQTREKRMFSVPAISENTRLAHQASWMCVPVTHDPTDSDIARNDLRRQKVLFKPQFD